MILEREAKLAFHQTGQHVRLGGVPRAVAQPDGLGRLRHETHRRRRSLRLPCHGFGQGGEGYLLLALVENEKRLPQAVRQIGRCLKPERATV